MRKSSYFLFGALILASCSAHRQVADRVSNREVYNNNKRIQQQYGNPNAPNYSVLQYIDRFKTIAIQEMNLYGIPASITLAQAIFESGTGNSELAKMANNHFGIKCTSDWNGPGYYKDDDNRDDCFRVYQRPEDSFRDHSEFLKRKRYASLFELDKNDYQGWAYGLKEAGYATNPKYPQLIISLIQKYNLDEFDYPETDLQKIKREDRVLAQINKNIGKSIKDSLVQSTPSDKLYTIKQGDTLYSVSKRFGLTVDELRALNNMADNTIKIGQKLVISR